ncbi:MAG: LPS assembly protein LptD [Alphaproteobacteria bacterium]|nr:LPS assembly protein LptD [Alphaproteobacteria bacterium]
MHIFGFVPKSQQNYFLGGASGLALLSVLLSPALAANPQTENKNETLITAQKMSSDQNSAVVTAEGKVEIAHAGYLLHADKVTYDQKTDVMKAEGHVALLTPSGEVQFADRQEITGNMKQAFAQNVGILFPDNSRLAARAVQRYDGRYVVADKGVYTSCNICKEDPSQAPLWQIRAKRVVHDNTDHDIFYHDATVDFAGVPSLYTPYISTPDPTVTRRQGLLTPTPGVSPNIGNFVRVPYYFDIAPDIDAVLAPTFSTEDRAQFGGEYRQRFRRGDLKLSGTFTYTNLISDTGVNEGDQWRGNLLGRFLYNINNVWRAGTDVNFTSDKSYLQRYRISSEDQLTNRAYVEGFKGRDYTVANMYYFQDLRPGTQDVQPLVLPQIRFSALGEPGQTLGGRWSIDGSLLVTERDNKDQAVSQQGPNTRRFSLSGGWERQLISDTGFVTTLSGLARADTYWADNVIDRDGSGNIYNNVWLARPFAQGSVLTRYPIGRRGDGYQQLLEPIVSFIGAPAVKVDPRQPIEDSLDVEFDETNLFMPNRFIGNDLIEGGSRVTYGLRQAITFDGGAHIDMFGGQSYDFSRNPSFPEESGLGDHRSDYVGRLEMIPADWLNLNYGFRLNRETHALQRQDARVSIGVPEFRPFARYISARQTETTGTLSRAEEATFGFGSRFAKYWTMHAAHTQAFQPQPGPRTSSLSLSYTDECFIFGITARQDQTNRADLSSGTSVVFHFYLRNVGGVHTDSFTRTYFPPEFRQQD